MIDDSPEHRADALEDELDSALRKLLSVLVLGKDVNEAAWWLCANHPRFLLNYADAPLLQGGKFLEIVAMAKKAGTPPTGDTWEMWFNRVRHLPTVT